MTAGQGRDGAELPAADEQLLRELTERARTGGLKLTGEGGLLGKLTKMVVEGALEGELDDHLGYGKHDPAGRDGGNSRNGHRAKTVITDTGPVEISVPRDRESSFEPKIVAKRQQRLTGVDDMVISLSAKGLTHGEIAAHLAEVYDAEVSKQTITAITDGCGSAEVSWLRCEDEAFPVFRLVDAFVLAAEMEAPVLLELTVGDQGAEVHNRHGAFQSLSCARDVPCVVHDVPARPFRDPGGDRPSLRERGRVVQGRGLVSEVAGALVSAGALGLRVSEAGGAAADP